MWKQLLVFSDGIFDAQFQAPCLSGGKMFKIYTPSLASTDAITASGMIY